MVKGKVTSCPLDSHIPMWEAGNPANKPRVKERQCMNIGMKNKREGLRNPWDWQARWMLSCTEPVEYVPGEGGKFKNASSCLMVAGIPLQFCFSHCKNHLWACPPTQDPEFAVERDNIAHLWASTAWGSTHCAVNTCRMNCQVDEWLDEGRGPRRSVGILEWLHRQVAFKLFLEGGKAFFLLGWIGWGKAPQADTKQFTNVKNLNMY